MPITECPGGGRAAGASSQPRYPTYFLFLMAEFIDFPEANDVLKAAPGTEAYVSDLPIFRQPLPGQQLKPGYMPCVVSCFQLSPQELAEVNRTGRLYLQVLGHTHPPVSISGLSPFVPAEQVMEPTPAADQAAGPQELTDLTNQAN